jgi:hypothetical protein
MVPFFVEPVSIVVVCLVFMLIVLLLGKFCIISYLEFRLFFSHVKIFDAP